MSCCWVVVWSCKGKYYFITSFIDGSTAPHFSHQANHPSDACQLGLPTTFPTLGRGPSRPASRGGLTGNGKTTAKRETGRITALYQQRITTPSPSYLNSASLTPPPCRTGPFPALLRILPCTTRNATTPGTTRCHSQGTATNRTPIHRRAT